MRLDLHAFALLSHVVLLAGFRNETSSNEVLEKDASMLQAEGTARAMIHPMFALHPMMELISIIIDEAHNHAMEDIEKASEEKLEARDPQGYAQYAIVCDYIKNVLWHVGKSSSIPDDATCPQIGHLKTLKEYLFHHSKQAGFHLNGLMGIIGADDHIKEDFQIELLVRPKAHDITITAGIAKELLECAKAQWVDDGQDLDVKRMAESLFLGLASQTQERVAWTAVKLVEDVQMAQAHPCKDAEWLMANRWSIHKIPDVPLATYEVRDTKNTALLSKMFHQDHGQYWEAQVTRTWSQHSDEEEQDFTWKLECPDDKVMRITITDSDVGDTPKVFDWSGRDSIFIGSFPDSEFFLQQAS